MFYSIKILKCLTFLKKIKYAKFTAGIEPKRLG